MTIEIYQNDNLADTVDNPAYSRFLPDIIDTHTIYRPMAGMATMPLPNSNDFPIDQLPLGGLFDSLTNPPDLPFRVIDGVVSIFGYDNELQTIELDDPIVSDDQSGYPFYSNRDSDYSFIIILEEPVLIGGICFQGYPFISSRIEPGPEGMSIGNFGLPREIRLTPLPPISHKGGGDLSVTHRSQFIDAEFAYTRQEMVSHSGFNYLTIDPVRTNLFQLTLTDLPFIPKRIDVKSKKNKPDDPLRVKGFKGFAIPYLYFFEYKEQTRLVARLHSGLIGVRPEYPHLPKKDGRSNIHDRLRRAFPEFEYHFFDIKDPGRVTGTVTDKDMQPLSGVKVKIKGKTAAVTTSIDGSYAIGEVSAQDILVFSMAGFKKREEFVNGRKKVDISLLPKGSRKKYPTTKPVGDYCLFTAHSALVQRREFLFENVPPKYPEQLLPFTQSRKQKKFKECFVSDLLQPEEKVILYLQQGEEFNRCLAGLKALFLMLPEDAKTEEAAELIANELQVGNSDGRLSEQEREFVEDFIAFLARLPAETNLCEKIGIKIYEIEPVEGFAPSSVALESKYSRLLAQSEIESFRDLFFTQYMRGVAFKKITTAKYFGVELTNRGAKNGHILIHSLQLIRSAHVSVQPKVSVSQRVKALHYRLIGPDLGDDLSQLGKEGFNFSIDRVTAGQVRKTLFSATSLLDLLHIGGAKLHSNVRRRGIEEERTQLLGGKNDNFHIADNASRNEGWSRNETGSQVTGKSNWTGDNLPGQFAQTHSQELRTHSETLSPQEDVSFWKANAFVANGMYFLYEAGSNFTNALENLSNNPSVLTNALLGENQILVPTYNNVKLYDGFENIWRGVVNASSKNTLRVEGLHTVSSSPFGYNNIAKDAFELLKAFNEQDVAGINTNMADLLTPLAVYNLGGPNLYAFAAANSLGLSVSVQPVGLGITLSTSGGGGNLLPSISYTNSFGTQGNIQKQASNTGYSYSQHLNNSYNETRSVIESSQGRTHRLVKRNEYPESDRERLRGAEVMWQEKVQDIVTGTVPLNLALPATVTKLNYLTSDDSLRVRFNSGLTTAIEVDFWFEISEEIIKDDY